MHIGGQAQKHRGPCSPPDVALSPPESATMQLPLLMSSYTYLTCPAQSSSLPPLQWLWFGLRRAYLHSENIVADGGVLKPGQAPQRGCCVCCPGPSSSCARPPLSLTLSLSCHPLVVHGLPPLRPCMSPAVPSDAHMPCLCTPLSEREAHIMIYILYTSSECEACTALRVRSTLEPCCPLAGSIPALGLPCTLPPH